MSECSISDIQTQNLILDAFVEKDNLYYTKNGYLLEQNRSVININFYLFWIYVCLILIYAYFLFTNGKNMTLFMKIGILLFFVIYPFIITTIEIFLLRFLNFLYDTMVGNVYVSSDY